MNMDVFPNATGPMLVPYRLKQKLVACELTIGSWICFDNSMVAEVMAGAGFEWLVIDQEHTAIDVACAKIQMIAIQARDEALRSLEQNATIQISKLVGRIRNREEVESRNEVKVVRDINGDALYFSREPIPPRASTRQKSPTSNRFPLFLSGAISCWSTTGCLLPLSR